MIPIRMEPLNIQLSLIKEMFPKQQEFIGELYLQNEHFRSVCEDYFTCIKFLKKFKKEFSEKVESIDEFENARKLLEQELSDYINKLREE